MNDNENKPPLIAAIDVGTNSFHLIVASMDSKKLLQIHKREKVGVRLGSSSKDMKYILPDAIDRGVVAMKHFAEIAGEFDAKVHAVATSACREAANKSEFINRVKDETGIDIHLVSGIEEGRLIYIGASHALPILNQMSLIIDIGGGSTETIVGHKGDIILINSAKLGAIRMTKRFFPDDVITDKQIEDCRNYIRGDWSPAMKRIIETGFETVIGTSGTIQNIAMMSLQTNKEYMPDLLNGLSFPRNKILNTIDRILQARTTAERIAIPGMDTNRADIIVGGALILEQAIINLNIQKIVISSYALREGIIYNTMEKMKSIQERSNLSHLRHESIQNLITDYKIDSEHAEHVKMLSLKIFDELHPLHLLGYFERELLEAASLLHDIGYKISYDQHHKHSYYIISHCIMPGFTNDEAEIIANIARYHRKSHPKKKHENFVRLTQENQRVVTILSGILRIAEGLDRRRMQHIHTVKIKFDSENIDMTLITSSSENDIDIELWGAERRKDALEEVFDKKINFLTE